MKKTLLFLTIVTLLTWTHSLHAANTECAGIETSHTDGNPFADGYKYEFKTTGTEVSVSFEMLDEKDGVVAFLWNKTVGFTEVQMTHIEGRKFTVNLQNQSIGQEITLACKFAYAGGMSVTKDFKYTVGNKCSLGEEDPDTEAPQNITSTIGKITHNSIELLLNGTDDSGVVIYEISYNGIVKTTSGASGVEKPYLITGLSASTAYTFSVVGKDATGNTSSAVTVSGTTTENLNTECVGITTDVDQGNPLDLGCKYEFKTVGADVVVTLELLDTKVGLIAFLWDKTNGFRELAMTHDSGQKYKYTLEGQTIGSKVTIACKFAYAGGLTVIKDLQYTVGEDCTGGEGEEDTEAPSSFSATLEGITSSSVQLKLNGTDNSGIVIYEITYGEITKIVSGVSGVEKAYTISDLFSGKTYEFSIIARDAAGNQAVNNPIIINAATLERVNECRGEKGHFGTPGEKKVRFEIETRSNGDVLINLFPIDVTKQLVFAEVQSTKGNYQMNVNGTSGTADIVGLEDKAEIGVRFLYRLNDMPGNDMTSETLLMNDANIIYYVVGNNCGYTGINENAEGKTLVVYPNPVKNELRVKSEIGIESILIYSTNGQLVQTTNVGGLLEKTLNVENLIPSTYILVVNKSDKTVSSQKIIKQ